MAGLDQFITQMLSGSTSAGGLDLGKLTGLLQPLLQRLQAGGGLDSLLQKLQQAGLGDQVNSWLGQGTNEAVDPQKLADAVGEDTVQDLANESGMSTVEVKNGLAESSPRPRSSPEGAPTKLPLVRPHHAR